MAATSNIWRRWSALIALATACLAGPALAADPFEPKAVRWEEDYAWLRSPATPPPADSPARFKFIPLTADRDAWLSVGGEARQRLDMVDHGQLGKGASDHYVSAQTRIYLHADARLGNAVRVFGQISYADEGGREPRDRSFDESAPDVQQLFVDLSPSPSLRLRLGRQELPLGDQRLSEVRETYGLRRSFDAVRLDLTLGRTTVTAFRGDLILNGPDAFDDRRQPGELFQGVYVAMPAGRFGDGLELFWLSRDRARSVYTEGAGQEHRDTWGARLHGVSGEADYNFYAVVQSGRFGGNPVRAWAASLDAGWTARAWPWTPRLGLRVDLASGDRRKGDGELNSFDAPYPNTSYLSTSSAYWPGNAWSVFPLVSFHPSDTLGFSVGGQMMGRMSSQDGFYYSAQSPVALVSGDQGEMMKQVYLRARWQPTRNWTFSGTVIRQMAGDTVVAVGGRDSTIVSIATGYKF